MAKKIEIYTDGGSRGNPGPSALGVVIGPPIDKGYSHYLGEKTNNEAEYEAVIFALKKLKALVGKKETKELEVEVYMDSKLAVNQLNYNYKIESENIIPLFVKIHNLRLEYKNVHFTHVPREKNKDADKLVNIELDR
ncbi:MAG: ribonuclease HI family protein, partial [Candidatus Spechtbacterales bacterium]|nr:ribonuclease HI family protein [Candidatus Spechtbacterales bacterium]